MQASPKPSNWVFVIVSASLRITANQLIQSVDTAQMYTNEPEVARAISDYLKSTGADRSSVYITTKWNPPEGLKEPGVSTEKVYEELQASRKIFLEDYDLKYVDLMLVHQSRPGPVGRANHWKALVKAQADGWIKDIGVSNQYVLLD